MTEFLALISTFPVALFTALMVLVVCYWLLVILGAADIDILDIGGLTEALDGGLDGAMDGLLDGALEGGLDAADGALDSGADGAGDVEGSSAGIAGVVHALGLHGVPLTVSLSLLVFLAWVVSLLAMDALGSWGGSLVGSLLGGMIVLIVSLVSASFLTSRLVRPLRPAFKTVAAPKRSSFTGRVCTVMSTRVDGSFGRAEIEDGGAGLLVDIRCNETNDLKRGDRALVFDYDREADVFFVSPADPELTA